MKETGIIMSGDHPRKCLDGTKTVTRRTWGLEKINKDPDLWEKPFYDEVTGYWNFWQVNTGDVLSAKCPYGGVGDLLIMRETWQLQMHSGCYDIAFKDGRLKDAGTLPYMTRYSHLRDKCWVWRPSIHMPYEFSRGLFEILPGLRPEMLQEITEEDARAEGIKLITGTYRPYDPETLEFTDIARPITHRHLFEGLWDSLNASRGYPWAGNWWIWRIPYKKLERQHVG